MARKSNMQNEVEKTENVGDFEQVNPETSDYEIGEQTVMFDLVPEDLKEIEPTVKNYQKIKSQRIALTAKEKELKEIIREFAHSRELKRNQDGNLMFKVHQLTIEIVPSDEKVKVTEDEDED
jgi:hypothetical protein